MSVILVFLDGVGLGNPDQCNPFFTSGLPRLEAVMNQKLLHDININEHGIMIKGVDACLGVPGLPQSATGQTSLLTGKNASQYLGYHLPAFPDNKLVALINEYSILKQIKNAGYRGIFVNAYTESYFERVASGNRKHSVTTHCMLAADLPFFMIGDLLNNQAVYWDITREYLVSNGGTDKTILPEEAGLHLASIAKNYEFVLYESFATDLIGHNTDLEQAESLLLRIDSFLHSLITNMDTSSTMIVCSDHGNIEDCSVSSHTSNPVPLIAIGKDARQFSTIESIDQVTPAIIKVVRGLS
jgi:hypothetical protein